MNEFRFSFESLPEELLIEQLLLLPPEDVISTCQTNRQFAQVCRRQDLWIRLLRRDLPLLKLTRESNPKILYLTGMMIVKNIPELKLAYLEDPIAFYNYSINHAAKIRGFLEILGRLNNVWKYMVNALGPDGNAAIHTTGVTILFPEILTESAVGPVFLNMLQSEYPDLYQAVIGTVQQKIASKQAQEDRIRYAVQNGEFLLQYRLPDGSLHGIRLINVLFPDTIQVRKYIEEEIIRLERGLPQIRDLEAEPIQEDSLRNMSRGDINYAVMNGRFYLRYQLPNGLVRTFELPSIPAVFSSYGLEQKLLSKRDEY